jgi:hypothetical protein
VTRYALDAAPDAPTFASATEAIIYAQELGLATDWHPVADSTPPPATLDADDKVLVRCHECSGTGQVEEVRAYGVCWATPHGFPDYVEVECPECGGSGAVRRSAEDRVAEEHDGDVAAFLAACPYDSDADAYVSPEVAEDRAERAAERRDRRDSLDGILR